jgi:hypothetical protein
LCLKNFQWRAGIGYQKRTTQFFTDIFSLFLDKAWYSIKIENRHRITGLSSNIIIKNHLFLYSGRVLKAGLCNF